jgi:type II secretion system protein C
MNGRRPRGWLSILVLTATSCAVTILALWPGILPKSLLPSWQSKLPAEPLAIDLPHPPAAPPNAVHTLPDIAAAFPGINSSALKDPLPLILTGTVMGRTAREGLAFIGTDERNPQTYSAGAILANGARLTEISKDYVVLEKNGVSARLYAQNVTSRGRERSELLQVGGVQKFIPALSTDTETFTQFIRPNPVYDGSTLTGYEVYAGSKAAVFSRLGLRAGDIITAFDDVPVSDPQVVMGLLQQLANGVAMMATVKRKGSTERLSLDGAIVSAELERASAPVATGLPPT